MTTIDTQVVGSPIAFDAIAPEWNALVDRSRPEALFARHDFLTENLRKLQADRPRAKPHLILLRRNGHLVAGLPFALRRDSLGTAVLEWLGSGTPLYACMPGDVSQAELVTHLRAELQRVPLLRKLKVDFVPTETHLGSALRSLGAQEIPLAPRLLRDLSTSDLAGTISVRRRKKLAQYRKRFMALGNLRIDTVTDPQELAALSDWIMTIKRGWVLQRQGTETWATAPSTAAYFAKMSDALARTGRAWGTALTLNGQLVCANLMFQQGDTVFWSKTAHTGVHAALSPGWLAMEHGLQTASERGARQMDMMMGSSYLKDTLATATAPISNFRLKLNPFASLLPKRRPSGSVRS